MAGVEQIIYQARDMLTKDNIAEAITIFEQAGQAYYEVRANSLKDIENLGVIKRSSDIRRRLEELENDLFNYVIDHEIKLGAK